MSKHLIDFIDISKSYDNNLVLDELNLYVRENDRARWWQYVTTGKVPAWLYFVKFEGMTKDEAVAMVEEAQPDEPTLFGEE